MYIFIAICLFFSFICNVQANILSDMKEEYSENVQYCLENKFVVKEQFVFTVGTARVIENKAIAMSQARLDASSKIPLLRVYNVKCPLSEVPVLLQKKIKENYVNLFPCRYKLRNGIMITQFIRNSYAYYVVAYKLSAIEFEDQTPVTWERIYNDFKNNPDKRNELVFYEIIPEKDMAALQGEIEAKLVRQYGKNFALMFMDKDVPPIEKAQYETAKKSFAKYNSATPLQLLVIAANRLPYDAHICRLLAEKFAAMQMPRCAGVMKKCASQSSKLVVKLPPPPPPQPVTPVVDPVPAAPAETPAVKAPAAPAVTPAVKAPAAPAVTPAVKTPVNPVSLF